MDLLSFYRHDSWLLAIALQLLAGTTDKDYLTHKTAGMKSYAFTQRV